MYRCWGVLECVYVSSLLVCLFVWACLCGCGRKRSKYFAVQDVLKGIVNILID